MAIDKNFSAAMLGSFRTMMQECINKNASGKAFDEMKNALAAMEKYAQEMDDLAAFSAKLTNEDLFIKFSNAYSEVLSGMAKQNSSSDTSDETLMQQTLAAYENSVKSLENTPNAHLIIPVIQEVIKLGKSGITYPVFLRICEEKGWNKAMEGSLLTREGLLQDVAFAEIFELHLDLLKAKELLEKFDEIATRSAFGVPDSTEFSLERFKIDWKYAPLIAKWNAIEWRWNKLFDIIHDWLDSYCSFAPYDERWASLEGMQKTLYNIKRCQECSPGIFKQREKIFNEYFNISWEGIFSHETYLHNLKSNKIWFSDACIALIKETYPHCKPFNKPPQELIQKAEQMHNAKQVKRENCFQISEENKQKFIRIYGQEKYDEYIGKYSKN